MSLIKQIILLFFILVFSNQALGEELKKIGKFKDWEVMTVLNDSGKVCFAQSKPVLQSPKKKNREARLFVTFRPNEKISDEISITSGYEYNKKNSIMARSGKYKYKFDISQDKVLSREDIVAKMLKGGLWPFIRQKP